MLRLLPREVKGGVLELHVAQQTRAGREVSGVRVYACDGQRDMLHLREAEETAGISARAVEEQEREAEIVPLLRLLAPAVRWSSLRDVHDVS